MPSAVELTSVCKAYPVYESPVQRLRELATLGRRSFHQEFWALRDVSLHVRRGEAFGIVGQNGSGKSTLLQIVAGILQPSSGSVAVGGRLSAILELGAGFNPEFSGHDNVYLNASILGLTRAEIESRYDEIRSFADIGSFLEQPVKTYSTGMVMRLAFSIAIHVDPEILVVDEALAVGDIAFRQRCMRRVHELRARGVTILFVSHEPGDIKALCDRCVWLEDGRIRSLGSADEVIAEYLAAMTQKDSADLRRQARSGHRRPLRAPEVAEQLGPTTHRYGDGRARLIGVSITDSRGLPQARISAGGHVVVRVSAMAKALLERPMLGFILRDPKGVTLFATNSTREERPLSPFVEGDSVTVDFHWTAPALAPGEYSVSVAVSDGTLETFVVCDYAEDVLKVEVESGPAPVTGYLHLPCSVSSRRLT